MRSAWLDAPRDAKSGGHLGVTLALVRCTNEESLRQTCFKARSSKDTCRHSNHILPLLNLTTLLDRWLHKKLYIAEPVFRCFQSIICALNTVDRSHLNYTIAHRTCLY